MYADVRSVAESRFRRLVLSIASLFAAASPAFAQTPDDTKALVAQLAAPAFCDIEPASATDVASASALYRNGDFRAAASQLASLARPDEPAAVRLRALMLWERSLKVMACDTRAFEVQRQYQREADGQPGADVERCHALGRFARLSATRNVNEAERLARQTLDCVATTAATDDIASEAHTTLAIVALAQSRTAIADEEVRSALQRTISPLMRSEALRVQGVLILRRDDDPAAAAQVFERSAQAATEAGDRESLALAKTYLGDALLRAGLPEHAAAQLDAGAKLARNGGMRRVLAIAHHLHGARLYRTQTGAALAEAIPELQISATLYAAIGDRAQEASVWLDLGSALLQIGDQKRAQAAIERSRELSIESGRAREAAKADHTLGLLALMAQPPDFDVSLRHLEAALFVMRNSGDDPADEARVLNDLAGVHIAAGRYEPAIEDLLEAARLVQHLRDPALPASINATLGWAYWNAGRAEPAHIAWRAALQSDRPRTRAVAWWGLAQSVSGSPNAALSRYARAVEEVERLRPRAGSVDDETRTNFGRRYSELYREYAALLLRLGHPAQAHWVTLLTQQQELLEAKWSDTRGGNEVSALDLPGRPDPAGAAACDAIPVNREHEALQRWSLWQRERSLTREACCRDDSDLPAASGNCAGETGIGTYCALRREVRREQRALLRLQDDCVDVIEAAARRRDGDSNFALPKSFREEWDKAIDGGVYLIVTIVEEKQLHVLLRRPGSDSYMTRSYAVTRAQLQDKADLLTLALAEAATLKRRPPGAARDAALVAHARRLQTGVLRELYDLIVGGFDPSAMALTAGSAEPAVIAFVLDRVLREVPMAALYDGERYLGERFAVSMVTPTTVAATLPTAPAHTALVMGVSKPDLPHVEGEIVQVARLLQASAFLNEDSTRTRLSAWLGGLTPETPALALHIASHAVMGGSKASSRLKLWDNEDLTGSDLDDLRRSLRYVQLVVLSACRSAGQGNSDLALGLAGLAEKGARSVLGSLWNVDDASTEQLMVAFYSAWRRDPHAGVAQALALAQRALLRDFAHPYFWASFEVIGRWN